MRFRNSNERGLTNDTDEYSGNTSRGFVDVWPIGPIRTDTIQNRRIATPEEQKTAKEEKKKEAKKESDGLVYVCGCDVGVKRDPSCIAIYEVDERGDETMLSLIHCKTLRLGLSFQEIENELIQLDNKLRRKAARKKIVPEITWVIDATGIGFGLVENVERAITQSDVVGAMLTSGHGCRMENGTLYVSKHFLITSILTAFESERIKIAKRLIGLGALKEELYSFEARVNAETQNETYEGVGSHDDRVIACALGCVYANNYGRLFIF